MSIRERQNGQHFGTIDLQGLAIHAELLLLLLFARVLFTNTVILGDGEDGIQNKIMGFVP